MRVAHRLAMVAAMVLVVAGCGGASPSPTPAPQTLIPTPSVSPSPGLDLERVSTELDLALSTLEGTHPEPFHGIERSAFVSALDSYRERLPSMSRDEAVVELMRVWAMLSREGRDGHQFALPLDAATDLVLPIRVYEFVEGLYLTDALPPYTDLIGARVTHLAGRPIGEVLDAVEPLVPRDGPATVPAFRPILLLRASVLRGLGLAGDGPIETTVEPSDREPLSVALEPIPADEHAAWAGDFGLFRLPQNDSGPSIQVTVDNGTLVVRYAFVSAPDLAPVREAIAGGVERLVLDLRQNPGGDNGTYAPLLELVRDWAAQHPGTTTVLIDRVTFSAASNLATEIEQTTDAEFVGEPMAGAPNFWDDVTFIPLRSLPVPMQVGISTTWWEFSDPEDPRLTIEPDVAVPVTAADYFADRDAALEAVVSDR